MKSKFLKITMIMILIMSLFQVGVYAELGEVTTTVETEKDTYKVGDKIEVTINWEKEVQALGMTITYDKDKLAFDSTTVGSNYYNADTEGEILYNWFSATDDKLTESTFTFVAKAEGKAVISVNVQEYADEEMNPASDYINVPKEITIEKEGEQQPGGNEGGENPGENPGQTPGENPGENPGQQPSETPDENEGGEGTTGGSQGTQKPGTEQKPSDKTPTDDKVDDTIADKVINNAGQDTTMIIAIAAFALIALVGFKKYRSLSDVR